MNIAEREKKWGSTHSVFRMAITVVYGTPGSGKTSLCDLLRTADQSIMIWSFDESTVVEGETGKDWRRKTQTRVIEGIQANSDRIHLIDDVFYLQSMRRPFERLSRSLAMEYATIYIETPIEVSIERDNERPENKRVGEEGIRRIGERIERSTVGEEMVYRSVDDLPRIVQWINILRRRGEERRKLRDEEKEREELSCSSPSESSNVHSMNDLMLRRIITQMCKGGADGRILCEVKRSILEETRREGREIGEEEMRKKIQKEINSRSLSYSVS